MAEVRLLRHLFGFDLNDYDELFAEKLELFLQLIKHEKVSWNGRYRAALSNQTIYPRPYQQQLPVWLGVGGTPESFVRAGALGLPFNGGCNWRRNASF